MVTFGRVRSSSTWLILLIHPGHHRGAISTGYRLTDMILSGAVNDAPALKGYGFSLSAVYLVWIGLVLALYPGCRWFAAYKASHQGLSLVAQLSVSPRALALRRIGEPVPHHSEPQAEASILWAMRMA
jgi:hypothetical protein